MSKKVQPPAAVPGIDAEDETKTASAETAGPEMETVEAKDDREFGRLPFQPTCARCTSSTGQEVRMICTRSQGPIAYYTCKLCGDRIKHGRPWKPKPTGHSAPNVAARPYMQE